MAKYKLPKFPIPNFIESAKNKVNSLVNSQNVPDFSSIVSSKMQGIQEDIANPDTGNIESLIDKFDTAKNATKVAKALGININEEQINSILEKKNELESMAVDKAVNFAKDYMAKQGHPIELPSMEQISNKLIAGEDPSGIIKDVGRPFVDMVSDRINNNSTDIDIGPYVSKIASKAQEKAEEWVSNRPEGQEKNIENIGEELARHSEVIEQKTQEILSAFDLNGIVTKVSNLTIKPEIPSQMQQLLDKYNITGGNQE